MNRFIAVGAMLFFLAGCNTLSSSRSHVGDPRSFLLDAAVDHDVKTIVASAPNLPIRPAIEQRVIGELNSSYNYLRTNFTTGSSANFREPYQVVFAINPIAATTAHEICQAPNQLKFNPISDKIMIAAVFCLETPVTEIWGTVDYAGSKKAANLDDAIRQLAFGLVPQGEPIKSFNSE